MTKWVVLGDGRLAIVKSKTERGIEVELPRGGRSLILAIGEVTPFNPADFPVQMSGHKRKELKAKGIRPEDEVRKVCNQCFTLKPVESFAANQTRKDGSPIYRPTCIACRKGIDGVKNHNTRRNGETPEKPKVGDFWTCSICEKSGIVGVTVKIVLDHGHKTGDARDYICDSCNTGLGRFRNGKEFLRKAVEYLDKWEAEENAK